MIRCFNASRCRVLVHRLLLELHRLVDGCELLLCDILCPFCQLVRQGPVGNQRVHKLAIECCGDFAPAMPT